MPSLRSLIDPAGRSLAFHIRRLQGKLEDLRERVRDAVSRLLGETVADAVQQVVYRLLTPSVCDPPPSSPFSPYYAWPAYRSDVPSWDREDGLGPDYDPNGLDDELREPPPSEPAPRAAPRSRWMRALSCGLRAAAWWLQRHSSPVSPIVAVGLGVVSAFPQRPGRVLARRG